MSTLICKFLYNLPQTKEWVRWVVIGLIIGMLIYFLKQKKDKLHTYLQGLHFHCIFGNLLACESKIFLKKKAMHKIV